MKKTLCLMLALLLMGALPSCALFERLDTVPEKVPYDYDLAAYIEVCDYLGFPIEKSEFAVTDEQMSLQIESDFAIYVQNTSRAVAAGDKVNLNYTAFYEGQNFGDDTENGFEITLGQNALGIPGFDEGLIGALPGDTVELSLSFPADYAANPEYAGKAVLFSVTVNYIAEELPELTDEMVASISTYSTVAAYREGVRAALLRANKVTALWERIVEESRVIQYPQAEFDDYYTDYITTYENLALQYNMTLTELLNSLSMSRAQFYENAKTEAQKYVKEDLIVYTVARQQQITVSEDEYAQGLQNYYDNVVRDYYLSAEIMEQKLGKEYLTQHILSGKVLDFLCENAVEVDA